MLFSLCLFTWSPFQVNLSFIWQTGIAVEEVLCFCLKGCDTLSAMWIPRTWCMCFTQTLIYTHSLLLSSSLLLEFMLPCLACGIQGYVVPTCFNYMLALSSFTFTSYISITTCVCCIIEIQDELGLANAHNLLWTHSKVSVKVHYTQQTQSRWCEHSNLLPGFL